MLPPQLCSFEALGTRWWIELFDDIDDETKRATVDHARDVSQQFEAHYSRFRPDSLVSELNQTGIVRDPTPEFRSIVQYGQSLYDRTNGIFNVLIGSIMSARGYDSSYSLSPHKDLATLQLPDPRSAITITDDAITLTAGALDIGGFGKGYLIDLLAQDLKAHDLHHFLINGGGDIYVTSNQGQPVTIMLEHPTDHSVTLGEITLYEQGFAASSPFKRQWTHHTQTYSHLMSGTTVPSIAAFTRARTARDADAFATAITLTDETTSARIAKREHISILRYDPTKQSLWRTTDFEVRI